MPHASAPMRFPISLRAIAVLAALIASFAAALALVQPARAATQAADIDLLSVSPSLGSGFGAYNFTVTYPGAEVSPFAQGQIQGHCVQLTQSAGDGPATLASGTDIALQTPGGGVLSAADQNRILWILLSSRASQAQPSGGLTKDQEGGAHQSAIWNITDVGNPGNVAPDPAAVTRAAALLNGSASFGAAASQAATFAPVGGDAKAGTAREVTVTGAPFSSATISIVSGTGTFSNGEQSIALALGAAGTATTAVTGSAGAVGLEAVVTAAEMVQVQRVDSLATGQDFAYAKLTPATLRIVLNFSTTKTSTAGRTTTPKANLRISKVGPRRRVAGSRMGYRIRITNRSKTTARNVVIRDILPKGMVLTRRPKGARLSGRTITWRIKGLAPGKSVSRRVNVRILNRVSGKRCNKATVKASNAPLRRTRRCTTVLALPKRPNLPAVTG